MAVKTRGAGRLAMLIRSTTLRDKVLAPFRHEWPHLNLLVDGPPPRPAIRAQQLHQHAAHQHQLRTTAPAMGNL
jgi:hypothetical protein